jgi:TPP-dependent pyruvate/acetoin dehydrogenase alpha subunit
LNTESQDLNKHEDHKRIVFTVDGNAVLGCLLHYIGFYVRSCQSTECFVRFTYLVKYVEWTIFSQPLPSHPFCFFVVVVTIFLASWWLHAGTHLLPTNHSPRFLAKNTYTSSTLLYSATLETTNGAIAGTTAATATKSPFSIETFEISDASVMRPPIDLTWDDVRDQLVSKFGYTTEQLRTEYETLDTDKVALLQIYKAMMMARSFENACNQQYMQGKIRGFMHLDNGQESVPALVDYAIQNGDKKFSYYREHTHAIASGCDPGEVMAELMMKDTGSCRGAGGSMHIFDKDHYFQGGWALVSEQLPYACGAAKSILLDRAMGMSDDADIVKVNAAPPVDDDRLSVVFIGEGGAQNGRMAELLNSAAKDQLPLLTIVIDNGRAINTFTRDVAQNSNVFEQGTHYGVPGLLVNGLNAVDVAKGGKAVIDYIRAGNGPAILQVHTYRFNGHSPADPEHERGRKDEKTWARAEQDPIKAFEEMYMSNGIFTEDELKTAKKEVLAEVKKAVEFAEQSPMPPVELAKQLEFPDAPDTDYNTRPGPVWADDVNARTISKEQMETVLQHIDTLQKKAQMGDLSIGDAINLAIHEEMLRDPTTTIHAEDLQAGSSYDIPKLTQQTYGQIRAADEIIDEGHFIGKALGEALNGYRPIVELMVRRFFGIHWG